MVLWLRHEARTKESSELFLVLPQIFFVTLNETLNFCASSIEITSLFHRTVLRSTVLVLRHCAIIGQKTL